MDFLKSRKEHVAEEVVCGPGVKLAPVGGLKKGGRLVHFFSYSDSPGYNSNFEYSPFDFI